MLPEAIVLKPKEHDFLVLAITEVRILESLGRVTVEQAHKAAEMVKFAISEIQRSEWLQEEIPKKVVSKQKGGS
jgi:phenylpyruvate tautomerase PptA (4-oxalocrotonate tautomerase family)